MSSDRETWLVNRMLSVGGSEAAQAIGESPWGTPLELYLLKLGLAEPFEGNELTDMGLRMESVVDRLYQDKTDRVTWNPGEFKIARNPAYPHMHATLDRMVYANKDHNSVGVLQLKNVGQRQYEAWDGDAPLMYQIQLQHEIACADVTWGSLAAIVGGQHFVWYDFDRNDTFIAHLAEQIAAFWRCVESKTPPPITGRDSKALGLLYPQQDVGTVVQLGNDAVELTDTIDTQKAIVKAADETQRDAEAHLKELIGTAEVGRLADGTGWSWKVVDKKAFAVKASSTRQLRRLKAKKTKG